MGLFDSCFNTAKRLVDRMGNGGIPAVHTSNHLVGDDFEITCKGSAIRGCSPINLCSWEEVNYVGSNQKDELGFVTDFSYKYKINAIQLYGYPSKLQERQFFVDDLGPLKERLREYKRGNMKENMSVNEAKEIIRESGKKIIKESYLQRANVEELYSFAVDALLFADQVHIWHWSCDSGFHHTHLEKVYDILRDFADELVEVCLSSGRKFYLHTTRELSTDKSFNLENAIENLSRFVDAMQATSDDFSEYPEITTIFDDSTKGITKEIGLMKSFK